MSDPAVSPVHRVICGFVPTEDGEWLAELDCGHRRHIRHRPLLDDNPWVQSPAGRAAHLGASLSCGWCASGDPGQLDEP